MFSLKEIFSFIKLTFDYQNIRVRIDFNERNRCQWTVVCIFFPVEFSVSLEKPKATIRLLLS